ncbi:glycoside hydrolase family 43 protein [Mangrovimonas sp. TPBH4]|uniref:glycoside hydrolase family 43 protein n=1 Tax=Mangrovimonas sp. TPBH4 TaxID=1645914 RepID=UPI0006B69622|nr:glycoside hydrolase family 43 protein [Mangrovimonas sp. TPBH4]
MRSFKNQLFLSVAVLSLGLGLISNTKNFSNLKQPIAYNPTVAFDWFEYKGQDAVFENNSPTQNEYVNPILAGFYPDPSICRAGDSYYLITSSFSYFPGLPIFKSTDLVNWKQIGHVITRKSQADFTGGVSRGLFAPTIRFHQGTFYVICTNVSSKGNFIVTSTNPEEGWSDPIWLPEIDGIDPDLFFDDDGKVYITHNGPPPGNISKHNGHRAIYTWEYDLKRQKIVSNQKLLVDGGTDMAKEPVWIEAPHIFKKNGYYYLFCAEGGTGYNHSEVVFRSKHIYGPYVSYENNPILTQRHLSKDRPDQITTAGHADFVELPNGDWWGVYLGCRPYDDDYYNTGRETFMLPVTWEANGWPVFVKGTEAHPFVHERPDLPLSKEKVDPTTGNFLSRDEFSSGSLDLVWNFLRTPKGPFYHFKDGQLLMEARTESMHDESKFSFIGRRQQHTSFEVASKFSFQPSQTSQASGLVAFQNEKHYLFIGKRFNEQGNTEVFLEQSFGDSLEILASKVLEESSHDLWVKIVGRTKYYDFYYKQNKDDDWRLLKANVDASLLSTKVAKGFVGSMLAMYASSEHF